MSWRFFQEVPDGVWIYKKSNKIVQLLFCLGKSKFSGGSQILSGRYFGVSELISGGGVCNPNLQLRDQYVGAWANHRYPLRAMTHMDPGIDPVEHVDLRCTKSGPPLIPELVEISIKWRLSISVPV